MKLGDRLERELVKCDGCGRLDHYWRRVVLSSDGVTAFDVQLCRRCESDTLGAVKLVWQALAASGLPPR